MKLDRHHLVPVIAALSFTVLTGSEPWCSVELQEFSSIVTIEVRDEVDESLAAPRIVRVEHLRTERGQGSDGVSCGPRPCGDEPYTHFVITGLPNATLKLSTNGSSDHPAYCDSPRGFVGGIPLGHDEYALNLREHIGADVTFCVQGLNGSGYRTPQLQFTIGEYLVAE